MRFSEFIESKMVPTATINQQVFQTFQNMLPGRWKIDREQPAKQFLQTGGISLLGNDVMQRGDQYFVSVTWTLYDDNAKMGGLYGSGPTEYDPVRGDARVSLRYGVQGYRPGDAGALGGMIKVAGKSMTPIFKSESEFDSPYQIAKSAKETIEQYHFGNFKEIPGGVQLI